MAHKPSQFIINCLDIVRCMNPPCSLHWLISYFSNGFRRSPIVSSVLPGALTSPPSAPGVGGCVRLVQRGLHQAEALKRAVPDVRVGSSKRASSEDRESFRGAPGTGPSAAFVCPVSSGLFFLGEQSKASQVPFILKDDE